MRPWWTIKRLHTGWRDSAGLRAPGPPHAGHWRGGNLAAKARTPALALVALRGSPGDAEAGPDGGGVTGDLGGVALRLGVGRACWERLRYVRGRGLSAEADSPGSRSALAPRFAAVPATRSDHDLEPRVATADAARSKRELFGGPAQRGGLEVRDAADRPAGRAQRAEVSHLFSRRPIQPGSERVRRGWCPERLN